MLLEFSIENFLSFKDRTTFSMVASRDKKEQANLIEFNKINVLKSAVVYGANASGKTNLIKAFRFVNNLVKNSHKNQMGEEISDVAPFKLDETYIDKPSSFEMIFIKNGIKYVYGFSADRIRVYDEYLFYYPQNRSARIFERHYHNKYEFSMNRKEQNALSKRTLDNALYLSTSANWNYEGTKEAFEWFSEKLRFASSESGIIYTIKQFNENDESAKSIKNFITEADVGIVDMNAVVKDISEEAFPKELPDDFKKILLKFGGTEAEIKAIHIGKDKEGKEKPIEFDFTEESEGTRKMFNFAGPFNDVLKNGRLLIIDELDTKLHPLLTKYLVELFHNPNKNVNNAQLIFTAHCTHLLHEKVLRRDQIWFTSKRSDQSTDLYSLYEYKARNDEDIEKRYLAGRYGAIPVLF
ncbi:AAA family ATPase [Methanothrix sp.]|uniref:AAA family ATPase n=1 Tax=Methanothrix sp. TaxID=90426 RepID=UPI003BB6DE9F